MDPRLLESVQKLISLGLEEDVGSGDVTTEACIPPSAMGVAELIAKQACVVSGLFIVPLVFARISPQVRVELLVEEGARVKPKDLLLTLSGPLGPILTGERLCLNFLARSSAVSTLTARYREAAGPAECAILDTRKTTPGWRLLEKWAVAQGGGTNHREGLFDAFLIKENHIRGAGGISQAITAARLAGPELPIQIEVTNRDEFVEALTLKPEMILLDNMTPAEVRDLMKLDRGSTLLEVSGGINLETIRGYAETGVDRISVGALTHSAPSVDLSLLVRPQERG